MTLALTTGGMLQAADDAAGAKLRDALRDATLQLRTSETDRSSLKAANTSLDADNKALALKVAALQKQLVADKIAADKEKAELKTENTLSEEQIAKLREDITRTRAEVDKAGVAIRVKVTEAGQLKDQNADLQSSIDDMQKRNIELYKLATEVLERYKAFSFGEALEAKEPFIGVTRTRLENLIQGYEGRLMDVKLAQNTAASKDATAPAADASAAPKSDNDANDAVDRHGKR